MYITVHINTLQELRTICEWYRNRLRIWEFEIKFPALNQGVSVTDLLSKDLRTSEIPGYVLIRDYPYLEVAKFRKPPSDTISFEDWVDLFA